VGDLTVDSTIAQVYWHDGETPGGFPLIAGAQSNVFSGSITVGDPTGQPSMGDANLSGFYKVNDVIVAGGGTGTANAVAGALPGGALNRQAGIITTEALTGATTYVLAFNNAVVASVCVTYAVTWRSPHMTRRHYLGCPASKKYIHARCSCMLMTSPLCTHTAWLRHCT
jgi:hypothetical protein